MKGRAIALAVLSIIVIGCATDPGSLQRRLEPNFRLHRPDGVGPFLAVMLVPGGTGFQPARVRALYGPFAEQLKAAGYAVVFVDYHAAYGLSTGPIAQVSREDVGQAILASAAHLRSLPFIKTSEIAVVGWSWGAGGALATLESIPSGDTKPFQAAALFYPVCQDLRPWRAQVPVFILLAELDDVAAPAACTELARRVLGRNTDLQTYAGARHAFDVSDLPETAPFPSGMPGERRTIGYNRDAAVRAQADVLRFLGRALKTP